jgi:hypothetical protein
MPSSLPRTNCLWGSISLLLICFLFNLSIQKNLKVLLTIRICLHQQINRSDWKVGNTACCWALTFNCYNKYGIKTVQKCNTDRYTLTDDRRGSSVLVFLCLSQERVSLFLFRCIYSCHLKCDRHKCCQEIMAMLGFNRLNTQLRNTPRGRAEK